MSLVKGEQVVVAEYNSTLDLWVLYGCAKSCTMNIGTSFIETSVSGSGKWATFKPTKLGASASLDGLVNLNGTNLLSLPDLRAKQIAQTNLLVRFQRTSVDGLGVYVEEFNCYIESTEDTGALDGMNTFSVSLKITGPVTQIFTPTGIVGTTPIAVIANVLRFQYTGIAGETSFTNVVDITGTPISLTGKTVLGLEIDGIGFSKMITTGTPVDKQFKFVTATGTITVPVPMDLGIEAHGYYR